MRARALLAGTPLLLAGCGTTTPVVSTRTVGVGGLSGSVAGGDATGLAPVQQGGVLTTARGGSAPVAGGLAPGAAAAAGVQQQAVGPSAPGMVAAPAGAVGPGVTATTIRIGLWYTVNSKAAVAAFGATGPGAGGGDGQAIWQAAVDDVNKRGGVLRRKLEPVYHLYDSTSADSFSAQEQQACTDWTQDHKVLWVSRIASKDLTECLERAHVASSNASPTQASTAYYRQYPHLVEAGVLQEDRIAASLPLQLEREGWYSRWDTVNGQPGGVRPTKVGVLAFEDPYTDYAVKSILVPLLDRITGQQTDVVQVTTPNSEGDNATAVSAIQAATLKFSQDGVTHVIPFETQGAGIGVFFAQGAQQQHYHPRYGFTSGNASQLYIDQGLLPASQMHGALGMGWEPLLDLTNADDTDTGPYSNAARRARVAVMRAKGIDVSAAIVRRQALEACASIAFFKAAMERSGGELTAEGYRRGAESIGSSFLSPLVFGTRFDALHHDGVTQVRPMAYQDACSCVRYTGDLITVG